MDARTLVLRDSMKRIAHLVNAHPGLRARANESTAFEQFIAVGEELDALLAEQCTVAMELSELRSLTRILMQDVLLELDALRTTAAIIPDSGCYWVDSKWPSTHGPVFHFTNLSPRGGGFAGADVGTGNVVPAWVSRRATWLAKPRNQPITTPAASRPMSMAVEW